MNECFVDVQLQGVWIFWNECDKQSMLQADKECVAKIKE